VRKVKSETIISIVELLCAGANFELPEDVLSSLEHSVLLENGVSKCILKEILENASIAKNEQIPLCQDTGIANFFVKFGENVKIDGEEDIYTSINKGVSLGYVSHYLRKSIVFDPIERDNTKDNTPANIYLSLVKGDKIEITFLPKGGGSENACALKMLIPSLGWNGVKKFTLSVINDKGRNACPPLIIGLGIGGDFSSVGILSKKALLRKIGSENSNIFYDKKEKELLNDINALNIGPMNMGGKTTALAVFIETSPTHIASLPVAVSVQCHSCRRRTVVI
jgi:fumarate hydratase subunit alpha